MEDRKHQNAPETLWVEEREEAGWPLLRVGASPPPPPPTNGQSAEANMLDVYMGDYNIGKE